MISYSVSMWKNRPLERMDSLMRFVCLDGLRSAVSSKRLRASFFVFAGASLSSILSI